MEHMTYLAVKWIVEMGDEFQPEYDALPDQVQDELLAMTRLLQQFGPQLKRPHADTPITDQATRDSACVQGGLDLSVGERTHPGPLHVMRAAESNIAIMSDGVRRATKTNTITCSFSARRCRKFAAK